MVSNVKPLSALRLLRVLLLTMILLVIPSMGSYAILASSVEDDQWHAWLWLRPGAYALYEGVVYKVHYYSEKAYRLKLEWKVLSVRGDGSAVVSYSLALEPLDRGKPVFNRSAVVLVDGKGFMYSLNGTYLGVWTLFRPPQRLVEGSTISIAATSPIAPLKAGIGTVRELVREGSMYDMRYLGISPAMLPALKFNLTGERVVEAELNLMEVINESRAYEIAERIWNTSLEYKGWAKYKIRIDYKPFIEGYKDFLLESRSWLKVVTPYYYDSITGVALAIRVGVFGLEWFLLDDVFQYLEAYRLSDYSVVIDREATVSHILSLYGYESKEDLVRSLGYDPGEFMGRDVRGNPILNVWLPISSLMLVDTNVFELMREAISGQGRGPAATTSEPATQATTAPGSGLEPHSNIAWHLYLLIAVAILSAVVALYVAHARRGAGVPG